MVETKKKKLKVVKPAPIGPASTKGVRFNPDGSVDVSETKPDQTIATSNLTQEDYRQFNKQLAGGATGREAINPKVMELIESLSELRNSKKKPGLTDAESMAQEEQAAASQQLAESITPSVSELKVGASRKFEQQGPFDLGLLPKTNQAIQEMQTTKTKAGEQITMKDALPVAISGFAELSRASLTILDASISLFKKDTWEVSDIKGAFDAQNKLLTIEIEEIKNGRGDIIKTIEDLDKFAEINAELESHVKRKGIDNVKYWLVNGRDLEGTVRLNNKSLETIRGELVNAIAINQAQMSETQRRLGSIEATSKRLQ